NQIRAPPFKPPRRLRHRLCQISWLVICRRGTECVARISFPPGGRPSISQLGTGLTLASCPAARQRFQNQRSAGVKYASKAAPMNKAEIGRDTKMTGLPPEIIRACLREFSDSFPRTRARIKGTIGYLSLIMT